MTQDPESKPYELHFEEGEGIIYAHLADKDTQVELYSDAEPEHFDLVKEVEEISQRPDVLLNKLIFCMKHQIELVEEKKLFGYISQLQEDAAETYIECEELKNQSPDTDAAIVEEQKEILYKVEKMLKHFLRFLSIGQGIAFTQRWQAEYTVTGDYLYLYGAIRNACSTVEYLGKLMINRVGEGQSDLDDGRENFKGIYEELKSQGLDEVLAEDQVVEIPPTGQEVKMADISLTSSSLDILKDQRNKIVHQCPIVIDDGVKEDLPKDILNTTVISTTELKELQFLSYKLHIHTLGIFLQFALTYLNEMIEATVNSWYPDT